MSIQFTREVTLGRIASIHRVEQLEVNRVDQPCFVVRLNHYADEAAMASGSLVWQTLHKVPYAALALDPSPLVSVEKYLIGNTDEYAGGVYSDENTGNTVESARAAKLASLNGDYIQQVARLTQGYPAVEQASWPQQVEEAKDLQADASAFTPWLSACAAARGIDREDLAERVLALNTPYRMAHGNLTGIRQLAEARIDAATTPEEVAAVAWSFVAPVPAPADDATA